MTKQVLEVDADDFAQLVSCVGFVICVVGLSMSDSPQKRMAEQMGDDLVDLMLKYSPEDKKEALESLRKILMTEEADTSVSH